MKRVRNLIVAVLIIALPTIASPQPVRTLVGPGTALIRIHQAQVEARIPFAPRIVTGSDGQRHLAYELRITSFQSEDGPLKLTRLTIFAGSGDVPITTVEGTGFQPMLNRPATEGEVGDGMPIKSGDTAALFVWLTLPASLAVNSLRHQLTFLTKKGEIERADDVRVVVLKTAAVRIAPPLRGGRWLTVEGPGNALSHHWGSPVAIDGTLSIPQRFAVDWFGLDRGNHALRTRHEDIRSTVDEDWVGFGTDVLAVADGVVVDARDGIIDGKPLRPLQTPNDLTARTLYGNFAVIKIAPGVYAHYAHLRRGSVAVRPGERVRRGAVIGRLGQTGSAGAPHLHFHISDRPTFERSEGLPFVIDDFTLYGREKIENSFDPTKPAGRLVPRPIPRRNQLPLDGDIIGFRPR